MVINCISRVLCVQITHIQNISELTVRLNRTSLFILSVCYSHYNEYVDNIYNHW